MMKMNISGSLARHEAKNEGKEHTRSRSGYITLQDRIVVNAELLPCTDCGTDIYD